MNWMLPSALILADGVTGFNLLSSEVFGNVESVPLGAVVALEAL